MTRRERNEITEKIRSTIEKSGLSRYEIAKRSGVDAAVLSRFMSGKGSLKLESIEKLAPVLGLQLIAKKE